MEELIKKLEALLVKFPKQNRECYKVITEVVVGLKALVPVPEPEQPKEV
jgi:hypothetical protein